MVDYTQPGAKKRAEVCLDELFHWVITAGGAITGEHGIGLAKKTLVAAGGFEGSARLHRIVKRALDPKSILNPGKLVLIGRRDGALPPTGRRSTASLPCRAADQHHKLAFQAAVLCHFQQRRRFAAQEFLKLLRQLARQHHVAFRINFIQLAQ